MNNTENTPSPLPSDTSFIFLANEEDVAERQPVEQQKQLIKQHLNRQTQALVTLARSQTLERGDLKAALWEITQVAASILEVERVSVWLYQGNSPSQTLPFWFFARVNETLFDRSQPSGTTSRDVPPDRLLNTNGIRLKCLDLYERSRGSHTSGMELVAQHYPAYFQALASVCPLAVQDARTHPSSQELSESYLTPNNITSILNAPICLNDQMVGMVCHEHIGVQRQWTLIEENFVAAIATLVGLTIETCDRVRAQKQMRQHHQFLLSEYQDELETQVELRTTELTKANEKLQKEINRRSTVEAQLRNYQQHLEDLVEEGTREIIQTNEQLQQEILRHQRAQEALRESEEQFRCLSEATFEAILITDRGNLCQVNSNFTQLFGYEASEVIGRNLAEFFAPEYRACVQQFTALNSEQMYETRCLKNDGTTFLAEVRSKAIPSQGRLVNVTAIRDITERARAEKALRQHLQQELLIAGMCDRIRQSLNLREILSTTVEEVRQFLCTDRVLIYRFEPDWSGTVVVESVADGYIATFDMVIHDPCFGADHIQPYQQGRIQAIADIHTAELAPCYCEFLSQLQVRANLVVPIVQGVSSQGSGRVAQWKSGGTREHESTRSPQLSSQDAGQALTSKPPNSLTLSPLKPLTSSPALWGLLIAHHCSGSREWHSLEIDLLKSLATQVAIAIQQSSLVEQLEAANQELQRLACVDGLTQVANRRRFDEYLNAEWERLAREKRPLSLILCDIDYFKLYNDSYGHLAGDFCLQQVADVLRQSLRRPIDLVARYGGEEFAMILPNTDITEAAFIAEVVRQRVRGLKFPHAASPVSQYVTLSMGVACNIPMLNTSGQELVAAADEALYQAKAEGRNRVVAK